MTSNNVNEFNIPTSRGPVDPLPTAEERRRKNHLILAGYLFLHIIPWMLPYPVMVVMGVLLIMYNTLLAQRVLRVLNERMGENSFMRSFRLLNPFRYQPSIEEQIVNAFVDTIAPDTIAPDTIAPDTIAPDHED
jgi:hypothetical protein